MNTLATKLKLIVAPKALSAFDAKWILREVISCPTLGTLAVAGIALDAVWNHCDLLTGTADTTVWINVETGRARKARWHQAGRGSRCLALLTEGAVGITIAVKAFG